MDDAELQRLFRFDPVAIYHACKEIDGYPGEGTFPIFGSRVLKYYQLVSRQFFYEPLTTFDRLRDSVFRQHELRNAGVPKAAIEKLVVAFRMFESFRTAPLGVVPLPKPGERELVRHMVAVDGGWEAGGESLRFLNSWGRRWGSGGTGLLSRAYLQRYMTEAWLARDVRYGPSIATHARIAAAADAAVRSAWLLENPRWRQRRRFRGKGHQLVLYETLSVEDERPVEVIEVCDRLGRRVAWAHLFHVNIDEEPASLAKEFFVWPWFRRQGYATWLLEIARDRAVAWHSKKLLIYRYEADSMPARRVASQAFARHLGLRWRYFGPPRPKVKAIAWTELP